MSLTRLIKQPEVASRIDSITPTLARKIQVPIIAPPRNRNWSLVGTAFDYLLRFEVQRRSPHAVATSWVAETAADNLWPLGDGTRGISADAIVDAARAAYEAYIGLAAPTEAARRDLAAHTLRLAKLDVFARAGYLDPDLERVDQEDVSDLCRLLDVVPFQNLISHPQILLNPTFGAWSRAVGGADADLIVGDLLVDFKVTKSNVVSDDAIRQLIGYLLLARAARSDDSSFPEIRRIALYLARHAHLLTIGVDKIVSNAEFAEVERWFLERFGPKARRSSNATTDETVPWKLSGPGWLPSVSIETEEARYLFCPAKGPCRDGCCRIHTIEEAADDDSSAVRMAYAFTMARTRCGCRQRAYIWLAGPHQVVECLYCGASWVGGPDGP